MFALNESFSQTFRRHQFRVNLLKINYNTRAVSPMPPRKQQRKRSGPIKLLLKHNQLTSKITIETGNTFQSHKNFKRNQT